VITPASAQRIQELIDDAVRRGAQRLAGGAHHEAYVEPTLLDHVPPTAQLASEETFGPVVTVVRVKDVDEALALASQPQCGLDACVFTQHVYRMWRVAKRLRVGSVTVNDLPRPGVGLFPYGGVDQSGMGREGIGDSVEEMTRHKTIVLNLEPAGLGKVHHVPRM